MSGVLHHAIDGPADEEPQVAPHGPHQVREAVAARLNIPGHVVFDRSFCSKPTSQWSLAA